MINFKVRFRNKAFLVPFTTTIIAFFYQMLAVYNVVPPVAQDQVTEWFGLGFTILGALGIIVDPTTKGFSDSERAMNYEQPN